MILLPCVKDVYDMSIKTPKLGFVPVALPGYFLGDELCQAKGDEGRKMLEDAGYEVCAVPAVFSPEEAYEASTCLVGGKPDGIMAEFLPRQWSYRGKFLGSNGLDMVSVSNLKAVKNLCESYCYSYPDCVDFLEDEQVREFAKGDIAMISTYNVHLQDHLDLSDQTSVMTVSPALLS